MSENSDYKPVTEDKNFGPGCFSITFVVLALIYAILVHWSLADMVGFPSSPEEIFYAILDFFIFCSIAGALGLAIDFAIYMLQYSQDVYYEKSEDRDDND